MRAAWHHHILNDRSLYGLPRKFNVGFDGGGAIPVLEDTNDIAFTAVTVDEGAGVEPASGSGSASAASPATRTSPSTAACYVKPEEAVAVADAIVRVFIDHGDRTDRKKARLKYVLDAWGLDKFLAEVEAKLGRQLVRAAADKVSAPNRQDRQAHIGVHAQKSARQGVGRRGAAGRASMTVEQMRGLASIARELGDGDIRLTVWQNLLISGVAERERRAGRDAACGDRAHRQGHQRPRRPDRLHRQYRLQVRLSNTKDTAMAIADWVEPRVALDTPDQHPSHRLPALLRPALHRRHRPARLPRARRRPTARTPWRASTSTSAAASARMPASRRELYRDVQAEDCPRLIERILQAYLAQPRRAGETFLDVQRRHDVAALKAMIDAPERRRSMTHPASRRSRRPPTP